MRGYILAMAVLITLAWVPAACCAYEADGGSEDLTLTGEVEIWYDIQVPPDCNLVFNQPTCLGNVQLGSNDPAVQYLVLTVCDLDNPLGEKGIMKTAAGLPLASNIQVKNALWDPDPWLGYQPIEGSGVEIIENSYFRPQSGHTWYEPPVEVWFLQETEPDELAGTYSIVLLFRGTFIPGP